MNKAYREFNSPKEADDWARKIYDTDIFNAEEIEALTNYCGTYFNSINKYKRKIKGYVPLSPKARKWADFTIPAAISRAPCVPENIVVYRKITYKTVSDHFSEHKLIEMGFLSTCFCLDTTIRSIDCDTPWCILKIYVSKGTSAFYVSLIKDRGESELLINSNCVLHFEKKYHIRHELVDNEKILIIKCRLEQE